MKFRRMGHTGLKVSEICLGTMTFGHQCDDRTGYAIMDKAANAGVTFLDTADAYPVPPTPETAGRTEEIVGSWLRGRRDRFVLATKCRIRVGTGPNDEGLSRLHVLRAAEDSLRRLNTDYIDLYQAHSFDPESPQDETLRAFDDLVRQGKVRYIGCSNLPAWQVVDAEWTAHQLGSHRFISCQDEYSLVMRDIECELVPAMTAYGLGLLPFFPLASGLLTGKYRRDGAPPAGARLTLVKRLAERYMTESNWQIVERLRAFSAERGHNMLELAFSWLAQRSPVASVIAGATSPAQLEENARAAGWVLTPEDMAQIDRITKGG